MGRTWTTASLAVFLLLIAISPKTSEAASWSYATHRVQMAQDPTPDQPVDEATIPAAVTGKKNIGKGVMFSLIIPGAGQLYSGSWLRAVPWFAIEVAGWAFFAKYHGDGKDKTTEFEKYAGPRRVGFSQPQEGHFNVNAYLYREYQIAYNPTYNPSPFNGDLTEWSALDWDTRQEYLDEIVTGYTHDVLTGDIQQYFEMIGKYINQFGFGWMDTWIDESGATSVPLDPNGTYRFDQLGTADDIWHSDDQSSLEFDGPSPMFYTYRDMRGEANKLLDKGNIAMEVVLINHVLSALDAAFAVRRYNKQLEQSPLGGLKLRYDAKKIDGELARFMTLSLPLN